jgi:hypothetical protein
MLNIFSISGNIMKFGLISIVTKTASSHSHPNRLPDPQELSSLPSLPSPALSRWSFDAEPGDDPWLKNPSFYRETHRGQ